MDVMIFLVGVLLGVLGGGALCIGYLRHEVGYLRVEIAADIGPVLKRMRTQLDNLEAQINLAVVTQLTDLSIHRSAGLPPSPK